MANPNDDEQTEFTLMLIEVGDSKISVLKAIRDIAQLNTHEAKDVVESAPVAVLRGVSREKAVQGKTLLENAGAWATIE